MPKLSKPLIGEDGEVRPLLANDRVRVSMLRDTAPALAAFSEKQKSIPKKTSVPIDQDIVDRFCSISENWQVQLNGFLHKAIEQGMV